MEVDELAEELKTHWQDMKEQLLAGGYRPQPVKRVEIPKPGGGGRRKLGIPTVIDRLIQQGLLQVLPPIFDPGFSEHSYGFRPGRSAQQAVLKSREYIEAGNRWVVDMDLEKFFDKRESWMRGSWKRAEKALRKKDRSHHFCPTSF